MGLLSAGNVHLPVMPRSAIGLQMRLTCFDTGPMTPAMRNLATIIVARRRRSLAAGADVRV
jgi:hypothetical protein